MTDDNLLQFYNKSIRQLSEMRKRGFKKQQHEQELVDLIAEISEQIETREARKLDTRYEHTEYGIQRGTT